MPQTQQLIDTLKRCLRAQKTTYADVAKTLGLSEASVKRLFSDKNLSLVRLEQICQMLNMEISDLVQLMNEQVQKVEQLSRGQEEEISADRLLLLVTVCALNRWRFDDILEHFYISETQLIRCLAKLDRLRIIELLPGNRIKLQISPNFHWIENGPIQRLFHARIKNDFFKSSFNQNHEQLIVVNGMLSVSSNAELQKKMRRLAREFDELNNNDAGLSLRERSGMTMVMAVSNWRFALFDDLRKVPRFQAGAVKRD